MPLRDYLVLFWLLLSWESHFVLRRILGSYELLLGILSVLYVACTLSYAFVAPLVPILPLFNADSAIREIELSCAVFLIVDKHSDVPGAIATP